MDSSQARVLLAQTSRGWLFSVLYSLSFSLFHLPVGSLGGRREVVKDADEDLWVPLSHYQRARRSLVEKYFEEQERRLSSDSIILKAWRWYSFSRKNLSTGP